MDKARVLTAQKPEPFRPHWRTQSSNLAPGALCITQQGSDRRNIPFSASLRLYRRLPALRATFPEACTVTVGCRVDKVDGQKAAKPYFDIRS